MTTPGRVTHLRFGVLGPIQVERDGQPLTPPSAALRGLLGVLLLAEGRYLPAGRLLELLWSAGGDPVRRGVLQVGVSRLRKWLDRHGGDDAGIRIDFGTVGYRLVVDPRAVDLSRLRMLLTRVHAVADPGPRFDLLRQAVSLSRGQVLADLTALDSADPLLRQACDSVREAGFLFAEAALATGRPQAAVACLDAVVTADPLDEPAYARLLELLAACGRPAEALSRYERLRARLAEDLGVSPSAEVQRVHAMILEQDRVSAATVGSGN